MSGGEFAQYVTTEGELLTALKSGLWGVIWIDERWQAPDRNAVEKARRRFSGETGRELLALHMSAAGALLLVGAG